MLDGVLARDPRCVEAWLFAAQAEQQRLRLAAMLERTGRAVDCAPERADAQLMHVHALMVNGETAQGLRTLRELATARPDDETLQASVAEAWSRYGRHTAAQAHYRRAAQKYPDDPRHLFNLAASLQASGDFERAEELLERVIHLRPTDHEAYGMRAALRKQTPGRNHVEQLERLLAEPGLTTQGDIHLSFALAKELEDLGEYPRAFQSLQRGARQRRTRLGYRVEKDLDALAQIQATFNREFVAKSARGGDDDGAIFVTGLPRSGTTLVDRILCSHSQVESLGEIDDLAQAITRLAPEGTGSLIARAARCDSAALGAGYLKAARGYGVERARFIDKSPLNFLYAGLIHVAMPRASLLHLARHPMDACFGMYKTLFRMGYPFSYDFDDLARYYAAYQRLMNHWRAVLPERAFMSIGYENLVEHQEPVTRTMLDFCGLDFEPACLEFHRNAAPVATASSVQVRRPMNRDAVRRWRLYEGELAPLRAALKREGVAVDE